ncbi:phage tail sheath family protein [Pseudomonas chlororaphis]|uniref:Phage tail sheath protein n=1 Tax=Pseudomonas chlororaphis TaxID=587753 RepID=A0AAX3FQ70_9PSED|nr:phage tail sheath C-terminal domain-containing protein [Pseudomonas chlororaphis]AZC38231.1 Phage tail sheath protein FI [Pseudomonas chlororaphis subsp. piscium]AZC44780.1 Phage tail sheath protein FI [Pseudomonas chlororaphis subsp. piscium]WDG70385.1 phage tail sheath C-terminal domain-containing protein [Pseudomonas chlororaphis]WDH31828.1 phage tail sheath C-terminal domain-containing protein [Pseudomonas chlororaphis]WDH68911.1 phage tail sheath C-terminal domain-containing protein [P
MPSYATPGVYIEEDASLSLSINNSPTAIPVFIGKFVKKDGSQPAAGSCFKIASWLDFTSQFSLSPAISVTATAEKAYTALVAPASNGAFAVQHYFNNGGGVCYVLPLVATDADDAAAKTAAGEELATLPSLIEQQQEITLLVCPETDKTLATCTKQQVYTALDDLLQKKVDYFLIADSTNSSSDIPSTTKEKTAVYYPDLLTSFTYSRPADANIVLTGYTDVAVKTLAALQTASADEYAAAKAAVDTAWTAAKVPTTVTLPPSAAVAGAYAGTDASRGVWKAPANVALNNATPVKVVTDVDQGVMNDKGINAIRNFTGKGTLIWGARTLDKTDAWRYVPVRRLFNSVERDIKRAMQLAVFEPNSQPTWETVRSAIDHYLYGLWQQGALSGSKASEAYFVQIGQGVTMTDDDINQGKMIVKVGMAAVRPAEFIILQFTQNVGQ